MTLLLRSAYGDYLRAFNGSSDSIDLSGPGNSGYGSLVVIGRRLSDTGNGCLFAMGPSSSAYMGFYITPSGILIWNQATSTSDGPSFGYTQASGNGIFGFSKATGSVKTRFHQRLLAPSP